MIVELTSLCGTTPRTHLKVCTMAFCHVSDTKTGVCTPVDYCGRDKCTTNHTTSCSNSLDGVTCWCKAGYDGSLCQHNADDCASDPCVHGTCTDGFQTYSCACDDGWEGNVREYNKSRNSTNHDDDDVDHTDYEFFLLKNVLPQIKFGLL